MSTSDKTFSQVKDILRKLDRSIDEAREKRLSTDHHGPVGANPTTSPRGPAGRDEAPPPPARAEPSRSNAGSWMSR